MLASIAIAVLLPLSTPLTVGPLPQGDNWPGWRGPGGNGVADGSPPIEWSEDENVRWKTPLPGKGLSCPVVWGDVVFVTSAVAIGEAQAPEAASDSGGGQGGRGGRGGRGSHGAAPVEQDFLVFALSRKTGEVLWEVSADRLTPHQGMHPDSSYATPTAVTDGKLVIASFGSFGIFAYDFSGELVWNKDLGDMDITRSFGEGASPVLVGDLLIVPWDNDAEAFLVALDKETGAEKWRVTRDSSTSWCTPLIIDDGEGGLQVVLAGSKTVAYDLQSGAQRWAYSGTAEAGAGAGSERGGAPGSFGGGRDARGGGRPGGGSGVISSPVVYDGVLLLSTGSRGGEFRALSLEQALAEASGAEETLLWSSAGDTPHVPSPIAYDGVFYSLKSNSGMLSAFDVQSGERLYGPERMSALANAYASPVAADGRLYFVGRDGTTEVVRAGAELETLAVNELEDAFDASPAVVGDELILRGRHHVYCIAAD